MAFCLVLARGRARGDGRVDILMRAVTLCVVAAGCSTGGPTSPRINPGSTPGGSISGIVSTSLGGGFGGVGVQITPSGQWLLLGLSSIADTTASDGSYTISGVPPGGGAVVVEVPAESLASTGFCTAPAPAAFRGLIAGGTVTVNITVDCKPDPWDY
jgi:hypothetical protein